MIYRVLLLFFPFCLVSSLFAEEGNPFSNLTNLQPLIMIALAVLLFYFILWRPEQQRRRALEQLRADLRPGDRVTAMGIVGTVVQTCGNTTILEMVEGAKIEVLTAAITDVDTTVHEKKPAAVEAGE